jgi:hypothetical protein
LLFFHSSRNPINPSFLSNFPASFQNSSIMSSIRVLLIGIFTTILFEGVSAASATTALAVIVPTSQSGAGVNPLRVKLSGQSRLSLIQRAKLTWKTLRAFRQGLLAAEDPTEGDRLAKSSRTLGIIGISLLAGIIIPYIGSVAFLGALVLGIIAIVQGRSARRLGSKEKTGEKLGYITVGIWLLFLILAVALLYLLLLSWGG